MPFEKLPEAKDLMSKVQPAIVIGCVAAGLLVLIATIRAPKSADSGKAPEEVPRAFYSPDAPSISDSPTPEVIQSPAPVQPFNLVPAPIATPQPLPSVVPAIEGYWVEVLSPGGPYGGWHLRRKPNGGEAVGIVQTGSRLYTNNNVYGRWLNVLCPDTLQCAGQWTWIAIAATREIQQERL